MRTTVRLDDALLRQAKKLAAESGRSLTALIEDALREVMSRRRTGVPRAGDFHLPTFKGRGLRPGVDLDNSADLLDLMEEHK